MKKRFSKFCSLLLTFAVTATTVLSSESMLLTTYADDEVAIVEEVAAEEEVAVESAEDVSVEEAVEAEEVVEEAIAEEAIVEDETKAATVSGLYIDPAADLVATGDELVFDVYAVYKETLADETVSAYYGATVSISGNVAAKAAEKEAAGIEAASCNKITVKVDTSSLSGEELVTVSATIDGKSYVLEDLMIYKNDTKSAGSEVTPVENTEANDFGLVVSFEDKDTTGYGKKAEYQGEYYYTGQKIIPTIVIKDGDEAYAGDYVNTLVPGKDYTVKVKNNKDVAIGAVKAKGNTEWDSNAGTKTEEAKAPCIEITLKGNYAYKGDKKTVIKKYFDIIPAQFNRVSSIPGYDVAANVTMKSSYIPLGGKVQPIVTVESNLVTKKGVTARKTVTKLDAKKGDYTAYVISKNGNIATDLVKLDEFKADKSGLYYVIISGNQYGKVNQAYETLVKLSKDYNKTNGHTYFVVYDKDLDLSKAKLVLSGNTVSWDSVKTWGDGVANAGEQVDIKNSPEIGLAEAIVLGKGDNKVTLSVNDLDSIEVYRTVGKQKSVLVTPNAEMIEKGIYPAWVKAQITVTGTDIAAKDAFKGMAFTGATKFVQDKEAKKPTFNKDYDCTKVTVADYVEAALDYSTVSYNTVDLNVHAKVGITPAYEVSYEAKKVNTDPVGTETVILYGNPDAGYYGKLPVVFNVNVASGSKVEDFFKPDSEPSADDWNNAGDLFENNKCVLTPDLSVTDYTNKALSYNKVMTPDLPLIYKSNSERANSKLYTVTYTLPKDGAGKATATYKFKGCLKALPEATIEFQVLKHDLKQCSFNDPSFKATKTLKAADFVKKAKLVVKDDACKKALKAGDDYIVSSNVYVLSSNGTTLLSVAADADVAQNKLYYLAVTANEESKAYNINLESNSNNLNLPNGAKGRISSDGSILFIPVMYGLTFSKNKIDDQVVYQKGDTSYIKKTFGTYVVDGKTLEMYHYDTATGKYVGDYVLEPCHNPKKETAQEYYSTAGSKKITLVAMQDSDKICGSVTVDFKVKVRETDLSKYKKVLDK